MSQSSSEPNTGRFTVPVSTTNLMTHDEDYPEFEASPSAESDARPRGYPNGGVPMKVEYVDLCLNINKQTHFTTEYEIHNLVVRRGKEFFIKVKFNRQWTPQDDFQLEFLIGANPAANKGSLVVVPFGPRHGGLWLGRIEKTLGDTLVLSIKPTATAIVGKYRLYVGIWMGNGMQRTKRDVTTDLYVLFNAWCPEDPVFIPNDADRWEYVLNDIGVIFQGSVQTKINRNWVFGQFEQGVLDACIYILDSSLMPIYNRGNVIKLVRKGSAMINSQDDNGVLVGNWSDNFSMGTPPTAWTGSVNILLQYANTGVPVSFAQCWVFAGVFNTFLRCLGIPARVITNFNSAHDNTGNLKTDLIFKEDMTPDRRRTRDSIWNYHCWNEVYMVRPDLPAGLGGWQCVDATPQETSDGHFRCGPASVAAIKEGQLCHPFDSGFVFAEVNSDVVGMIADKYGTLTPVFVHKTHVGQDICTKAVGSNAYVNITHTYKYPEGSAADKKTMARAEEYGCERDHSQVEEGEMSVMIDSEQCVLGQDVNLLVTFHNKSDRHRSVTTHLGVSVIFYTGVMSSHIKEQKFDISVPPFEKNGVRVKLPADEYMPHVGTQVSLFFIMSGISEDQSLATFKIVDLQTPPLTFEVPQQIRLGEDAFIIVSFTNPLKIPLTKVSMYMEGPGLIAYKHHQYSVIAPGGKIEWKQTITPRRLGKKSIVVVLDCENLKQVWGIVDVKVVQ